MEIDPSLDIESLDLELPISPLPAETNRTNQLRIVSIEPVNVDINAFLRVPDSPPPVAPVEIDPPLNTPTLLSTNSRLQRIFEKVITVAEDSREFYRPSRKAKSREIVPKRQSRGYQIPPAKRRPEEKGDNHN